MNKFPPGPAEVNLKILETVIHRRKPRMFRQIRCISGMNADIITVREDSA